VRLLTTEEIVALYEQRRRAQGPLQEQMRRVRDLANGDVIVPLNELDKNAKASVANLLVQGLDQMSMRVASTMPSPYFPPVKEGSDRSKSTAKMRKRAMMSIWDHNRMQMKMRRRARHLLGYSQSAVVLKPDFKTLMPTWTVRNPLDTYPAFTDDPDNPVPEDCIFTYKATATYLLQNYGDLVLGKLRLGKIDGSTKYTMLEYVSPECIQLVVLGADDNPTLNASERAGIEALTIEYIPNRTGMPLAVVANRITLDRPRGQFDGVMGMYYTRARLQALTEIAIERGIFPEEYLIARPGENPEIMQVANGKQGQLGIVKGGDIQQLQLNPGYKTDTALDRLERQERLEGAIPAEFGGESASNIRTGRRGESVLSATVDFRVQEAQATFEQSLYAEDKIAIAIEKAYWGNETKTFYMSSKQTVGMETYQPNKIWQTDFHYVAYSAAGSDVNSLIVGLGQRLGTGLMSKESAREADPLISDPDLEHDRIIAEGVESALLSSIQQQAANPEGPYQPEDLAYLTKLVVEQDVSLFDAVKRTDQRAKDRQAAQMPAGAPETMPGLAMPGMGAQQPAEAPAGPPGIEGLLAQLGGG
tara:strand:+ start:278 stop:2044 length:1767 start_codon:yes stop_codon:yes gene_type:complete